MVVTPQLPPIAPGQKLKIEIFNNGNDLLTYITYPDMGYSKCKCTIYLIFLAALIAGIYYFYKTSCQEEKPIRPNPTPPDTNEPSTVTLQEEENEQKSDATMKNKRSSISNSQQGEDDISSMRWATWEIGI